MKPILFILSFFFCLGITAQTTSIPDPNFEQHLIDEGIDSDQTINGQVLTSDIASVLSLDLSGENISSLDGIEDFNSLKVINVSDAGLSSVLDLSQVESLEELYMDSGGDSITLFVKEVILTNNPNLQIIQAIDVWMLDKINLKGSDIQLNNLAVDVEKYGEESGSSVCIEVTDPIAAQNQQGIYSTWFIFGNSNFSDNCNLSAAAANKTEVALYPNPVQNSFQIETSEQVDEVGLYSVTGKEVAHFNLQQDYNIANLPAGVYFVSIKSGAAESIEQIIKR